MRNYPRAAAISDNAEVMFDAAFESIKDIMKTKHSEARLIDAVREHKLANTLNGAQHLSDECIVALTTLVSKDEETLEYIKEKKQ